MANERLDVDDLRELITNIEKRYEQDGYQNRFDLKVWDLPCLNGPPIKLSERDRLAYSCFLMGLPLSNIVSVIYPNKSQKEPFEPLRREVVRALGRNLAAGRPVVLARPDLGVTPKILGDVVKALNSIAADVNDNGMRFYGSNNLPPTAGTPDRYNKQLVCFGWARGAVRQDGRGQSTWSSHAECCRMAHAVQPVQFMPPVDVSTWNHAKLKEEVSRVLHVLGVESPNPDASPLDRERRARVLHVQTHIAKYLQQTGRW